MKLSLLKQIIKEEVSEALNESPRLTNLIWSKIKYAPMDIKMFDQWINDRKQAIQQALSTTLKGAKPENILVYVCTNQHEAERLKKEIQGSGVLGVWPDKLTFVFVQNQ